MRKNKFAKTSKTIIGKMFRSSTVMLFPAISIFLLLLTSPIYSFDISQKNKSTYFRYADKYLPVSMNPVYTSSLYEEHLYPLLFDSLFKENDDLRSTPFLVQEYRIDEKRQIVNIKLKKGLKWQDGHSLTSDDIIFTINAYKQAAGNASFRVDNIQTSKVINDLEFEVIFRKTLLQPENAMSFPILPSHKFSNQIAIQKSDTFRNKIIGSGPYKIAGYFEDDWMLFERNPFSILPPFLSQIIVKSIFDTSLQTLLLNYEQLDGVSEVDPHLLSQVSQNRNVTLYPITPSSWPYIAFNLKNPLFSDIRLRKAINMSLNVSEVLKPIGSGDILSGPFLKSSPYYCHDPDVKPNSFNPSVVMQLMKSAGYLKKSDFWEKNGKVISLRVAVSESVPQSLSMFIIIQQQLLNQGFKVVPVWVSEADFKKNIFRDQNFDLAISLWSIDSSESIFKYFHSAGSNNFFGYNNIQIDHLLDQALDTTDPQLKKQSYRQVHRILNQEFAFIFLWSQDQYAAFSSDIDNVTLHPRQPLAFIRDWVFR